MNRVFLSASALAVCLAFSGVAAAEIKVMASIKPVHSLVASVMGETGQPGLVVDGAGSPHTYSLKPREAAALQSANVIFWVGHELEAFLEKPIEALPQGAKVVALMDAQGVQHLPVREGDGFDAHEHDDGHGHDEEAGGEEGHHEEHDAHVWLDPVNAAAMVDAIATTLSEADPANASVYSANAAATKDKLGKLQDEVTATASVLKGKQFIVFHDAYQYFEKRFGLAASGAISIHPETPPGAKGIRKIKERLASAKVSCVFSEPQFDTKLVDLITEGTSVKTGVMDPLGAALEPGPNLYAEVLRGLVTSMKTCFGA